MSELTVEDGQVFLTIDGERKPIMPASGKVFGEISELDTKINPHFTYPHVIKTITPTNLLEPGTMVFIDGFKYLFPYNCDIVVFDYENIRAYIKE